MRLKQSLSKKFELDTKWNSSDADEVRKANKKLWQEFRKSYFEKHKEEIKKKYLSERGNLFGLNVQSFPNRYIPGFLEYIQQLKFEGDSFEDIGVKIGVSRERAMQYFKEYDLKTNNNNGAMYRIPRYFISDTNKDKIFVPITPENLEEILKTSIARQREVEKGKKLADKIWTQINAIRNFAEEHGWPPTMKELGEIIGYGKNPYSQIAEDWGYESKNKNNLITPSDAVSTLYWIAGFEKPFIQQSARDKGTIGYRITQKRLELGLSQKELAEKINISQCTIGSNERNRHRPRKKTLKKLADFFSVTEKWILTGEN